MIRRMSMRLALVSLLLVLFASTSQAQLQGIVDVHAHSDPDNQPRRLDGLELAKEAKTEGMRGAVLKNHQMPTTQLAYMVNQLVPGFQAFGSLVLNRAVGGINPQVVEQQATVKGKFFKVVFMPTVDAESPQVRNANRQGRCSSHSQGSRAAARDHGSLETHCQVRPGPGYRPFAAGR